MKKRLRITLLVIISLCTTVHSLYAQSVTVSGTVYDISARRPLEAVAVLSSSGRGTLSDSAGHYSLTVKKSDSIWFSLLNKSTMKFAVDTIVSVGSFDVSLHVQADLLPEVKVRNRDYHLDSLINRQDYAKYFNYRKPGIRLSDNMGNYTPGGVTVGLDLDELINMFRFKRNRNLEYLQNRLVQQEQDGYIDHRFSKQFIRKITKLQSPELETFMQRYRPTYEFVKQVNDLELGYYVEQCLAIYQGYQRGYTPAKKQ